MNSRTILYAVIGGVTIMAGFGVVTLVVRPFISREKRLPVVTVFFSLFLLWGLSVNLSIRRP